MQEICQSGSEGGAKLTFVPTPILAQGGGLAEPLGISSKKARSSEGAKESVDRRAIKAAQYSRITISCDVAGFCRSFRAVRV